MEKLPKMGLGAKLGYFRWFFHDFSGCVHARVKISIVLESAHQAGSNDTHIEYIYDKKIFSDQRGDPLIF